MADGEATRDITAYVLDIEETVEAPWVREYLMPSKPRSDRAGTNGLIPPPLDLRELAAFYDESTWHRKATNALAQDVVGNGWRLVNTRDPEDENVPAVLQDFFESGGVDDFVSIPGSEGVQPLQLNVQEICRRLIIDHRTTGNAYLGVIRKGRISTGEPEFLVHIPAIYMRWHKDQIRLAWEVNRQKRHWFKRYGVEAEIDNETGDWVGAGERTEFDRLGIEVIPFVEYSPTNVYYGKPDITPALGAILMDLLARDFNLKFFGSNAIPQYAVIFEGWEGDLPEQTRLTIADFFQNRAPNNPHSTLVISIPPTEDGIEQKATIKFEKLAAEVREGHFKILRDNSRDEILASHNVPGHRLGIHAVGALGGSTVEESDDIYKSAEVDPLRSLLGVRITDTIIRQGFEIADWAFEFDELDLSDYNRDAEVQIKLVLAGIKTPNQALMRLGEEPHDVARYPEAEELRHVGTGQVVGAGQQRAEDESLETERRAMLSEAMRGSDAAD